METKVCLSELGEKLADEGLKCKKVCVKKIRPQFRGSVTASEVSGMSLSSLTCKLINRKARAAAARSPKDTGSPLTHINDGMFVKSERVQCYNPQINYLRRISLEPSGLCPEPYQHLQNLCVHPLPLACPTCWSVGRNGQSAAASTD